MADSRSFPYPGFGELGLRGLKEALLLSFPPLGRMVSESAEDFGIFRNFLRGVSQR